MEAEMVLFVQTILALCLLAAAPAAAAMAGEPDISGLWRGSLYGSDLQAHVEQDGNHVKAEVVVHALTGETNVYHVVGAVFDGHMYVLHGSGHVFEGEARGDLIRGVLTTKGGSRIELQATKVPMSPAGQNAKDRSGCATPRQPG
jgi:hypothetical protein